MIVKNNYNFPNHVAFIMDGNRRWAKKYNLPVIEGHRMGIKSIKKVVRKSLKLKIKYLTFYGFSTENWKRSPGEVKDLKELLVYYIDSEIENFIKNKINFSFIGDVSKFNSSIIKKLKELNNLTKTFESLYFILALSYGSRNEIINAVKKINSEAVYNLSEKSFSGYLMTKKIPDPDLVIRTSGEKRLSNFLLWQIAYSELYFTKTLWPDFGSKSFQIAINDYVSRNRRFGKDLL